jgi:NAD(P)H-flavin reductase/formate hydrogenlyase subunit 6/NADH:ubiquinone oxidoreductase subunit I
LNEVISQSALRALLAALIDAGQRVAGPVRIKPDLVLYSQLSSADELQLEGFIRPRNSIKEFVLPREERLYGYRLRGREVELLNETAPFPGQIIVAARPCDAAALPILDHIFNWDPPDELYRRRRAATTVVTLACSAFDEHCFCTSVGLSPVAERGSDVMLYPAGQPTAGAEPAYHVRCVTDKGRAWLQSGFAVSAGVSCISEEAERADGDSGPPVQPPRRFDPETVRAFLHEHFEDPFWAEHSLTCVGCGVCAFSCPTCHCFDIVDAGKLGGQARVRTWDSCQFPMFTAQASGHNPRPAQAARQRQRLLHKFEIYPEKFGEVLCTGCGNCARNCPEGLGIPPVLAKLQDKSDKLQATGRKPEAANGQPASHKLPAASYKPAGPTANDQLTSHKLQATSYKPAGLTTDDQRPTTNDQRPTTNDQRPSLMEVISVRRQTPDVKSMALRFLDAERTRAFRFRAGQFGLFSAFGYGEAAFSLCSSTNWSDRIEFCFRKVGRVTEAFWELEPGGVIGFRGPYGNGFPMETWQGRDLIFLGGGIAMPPLRSAVWYALENRAGFGEITVVYGARTAADLVYADELEQWAQFPRVRVIPCVDPGGEEPGGRHEIGLAPQVLERAQVRAHDPVVLVVGPAAMIRSALPVLDRMGVASGSVYTSLETRMKCGIGKCGRCNVGPLYVCKEGPVVTLDQWRRLPADY